MKSPHVGDIIKISPMTGEELINFHEEIQKRAGWETLFFA